MSFSSLNVSGITDYNELHMFEYRIRALAGLRCQPAPGRVRVGFGSRAAQARAPSGVGEAMRCFSVCSPPPRPLVRMHYPGPSRWACFLEYIVISFPIAGSKRPALQKIRYTPPPTGAPPRPGLCAHQPSRSLPRFRQLPLRAALTQPLGLSPHRLSRPPEQFLNSHVSWPGSWWRGPNASPFHSLKINEKVSSGED